MSAHGFGIAHFNVADGKVVLEAIAPTEYLKDAAWDEIKKCDSTYADLDHNITVGSGTTYEVKSGDNLSKISKEFYGTPNDYSKIADANSISDPNLIKVGQQLTIPA
jgi:nucleoid-associated protein YgaU